MSTAAKTAWNHCLLLWPTLSLWAGGALALIVLEAITAPPFALDRWGLALAQSLRGAGLDVWCAAVTWTGSLRVLLPVTTLAVAGLAWSGRNGDAWLVALGLLGASVAAHASKPWFARIRPDLFVPVGSVPADASYPSAHTTQAVAVALSIFLTFRPQTSSDEVWLGAGLLAWALAVGASRIYLQVHYPTDVAAGAMLAVCWVFGLEHFMKYLEIR